MSRFDDTLAIVIVFAGVVALGWMISGLGY